MRETQCLVQGDRAGGFRTRALAADSRSGVPATAEVTRGASPGPEPSAFPHLFFAHWESVSRGRISCHMRSHFKALISLSSLAPMKLLG